MNTNEKGHLKSLVIETKMLSWKNFQFIQQDDFKSLS